jgi:hypothetical protein
VNKFLAYVLLVMILWVLLAYSMEAQVSSDPGQEIVVQEYMFLYWNPETNGISLSSPTKMFSEQRDTVYLRSDTVFSLLSIMPDDSQVIDYMNLFGLSGFTLDHTFELSVLGIDRIAFVFVAPVEGN